MSGRQRSILVQYLFKDKCEDTEISYGVDKTTKYLEDYQIDICQDGKFAITFDRGKFHCSKRSFNSSSNEFPSTK